MKNNCVFIAFGSTWSSGSSVPCQFKALADILTRKGTRIISLIQGKPDPILSDEKDIFYWPSKRPTKIADAIFLLKLMKKYRPRCIITQFAATNIMVLVSWICQTPYRIVWYHTLSYAIELDSKKTKGFLSFQRLRKTLIYLLATYIIPVSKYALKDFQETFGLSKKSRVFYNGVTDPIIKNSLGISKSNFILCIARLDFSKGQDILIKAFKKVVDVIPDCHLFLVGDGIQQSTYKSLVTSLNLEKAVTFIGRVSPIEVHKLLMTAKLSVLPSRMDNCPLAIIESLSMGVPVIASKVGGIPEIVEDGISGFLVENEDIESFSQRIIEILKNDSLSKELSKNARSEFLKKYEVSHTINQQVAWLEEIGVIETK